MERMNFSLPVPLLQRLRAFARRSGYSMSDLVRQAVAELLKNNKA